VIGWVHPEQKMITPAMHTRSMKADLCTIAEWILVQGDKISPSSYSRKWVCAWKNGRDPSPTFDDRYPLLLPFPRDFVLIADLKSRLYLLNRQNKFNSASDATFT